MFQCNRQVRKDRKEFCTGFHAGTITLNQTILPDGSYDIMPKIMGNGQFVIGNYAVRDLYLNILNFERSLPVLFLM